MDRWHRSTASILEALAHYVRSRYVRFLSPNAFGYQAERPSEPNTRAIVAMLEAARDPALKEETRETNPDERGLYFRIEVVRLDLKNQDGQNLDNLFEVTVTAIRESSGGRRETLDQATTYANPNLL